MNDKETELIELNKEEAKQYLGGFIFVAIIMIIGFVGNLHVILVYAFKMKPSNHRIFILVLGVLDMITCTVGMPFILVDLRKPLTFTMTSACKILRFINYFICASSALTLIVIATDRYRKICVPLGRQISQRMAKVYCCIVLFVALCISWPAPVLYGNSAVQTSNPNINGTRCYTEDKTNFVKYQAYFNTMLILLVLVTFITLVVLYLLIWRIISKHSQHLISKPNANKERLGDSTLSNKVTTDTIELSSVTKSVGRKTSDKSFNKEKGMHIAEDSDSGSKYSENESGNGRKQHDSKKTSQKPKQSNSDRGRRTTLMFLLITSVFFLSYIPHLSLKTVAFLKKDFVAELSFSGKVLYNTFVWCFFINNTANCFIYGFLDKRFMSEIRAFYGRFLCRICKVCRN